MTVVYNGVANKSSILPNCRPNFFEATNLHVIILNTNFYRYPDLDKMGTFEIFKNSNKPSQSFTTFTNPSQPSQILSQSSQPSQSPFKSFQPPQPFQPSQPFQPPQTLDSTTKSTIK